MSARGGRGGEAGGGGGWRGWVGRVESEGLEGRGSPPERLQPGRAGKPGPVQTHELAGKEDSGACAGKARSGESDFGAREELSAGSRGWSWE